MVNGFNIIAANYTQTNGKIFTAADPSTGQGLDGVFYEADEQAINQALNAATEAFKVYCTAQESRIPKGHCA